MEFKFPDVGEGISEGKLLSWKVKEGDKVKEDDVLAEVETDKAVVEVPSPTEGRIQELHAKEGDMIKVGEVIVTFGDGKKEKSDEKPKKAQKKPQAEKAQQKKPKPEETQEAKPQRVLATPHTRKLARKLEVNLHNVKGTGPGGRITDEDVQATEKAPAVAKAPSKVMGKGKREELSGVRQAIAKKMVESSSHAVHVTHCDEADVTELVHIREEEKKEAMKRGIKLTYLPFIAKATMAALRKFPQFNAALDEDTNEIVYHDHHHLGMALATDYGLLVPVIEDADRYSIFNLGKEMHEIADRGRARRLKPVELKGSTFTITNVGSIGGTYFTPIINYPECAILGIGRIMEVPRIVDGKIQARHILFLSLSFDHRIADGAEAARFMNEIKAHLEDPQLLLVDI